LSRSDFRWWLGGQGQFEFLEQQLQFGLGLRVAREGEFAPIGGGHIDVDHLHGGELLEHGSRRKPRGERLEVPPKRHVQAVSQERDEDVRFDAPLLLMEDRADREIAFERFEGRLDFDQLRE
jgi:hypothetical protein